LKAELTRMKQNAAESRAQLEAVEMEERKLLKIIGEADAERLRQKKELDQVIITMMMMMMMMVVVVMMVMMMMMMMIMMQGRPLH